MQGNGKGQTKKTPCLKDVGCRVLQVPHVEPARGAVLCDRARPYAGAQSLVVDVHCVGAQRPDAAVAQQRQHLCVLRDERETSCILSVKFDLLAEVSSETARRLRGQQEDRKKFFSGCIALAS